MKSDAVVASVDPKFANDLASNLQLDRVTTNVPSAGDFDREQHRWVPA